MNKFFIFIKQHAPFLIFVILEVVALLLFVNHNALQRSVVYGVSTICQAALHKNITDVSDYFGLKQTNALLAEENIELRNELAALQEKIDAIGGDSLLNSNIKPSLNNISAKVVYNRINSFNNYLIIDKGKRDGIKEYMGVIASQGVVGTVVEVTNNYAVVNTLINVETQVSAKIKNNNLLGLTHWNGRSISSINLEQIPNHVSPVAGDTIVTSGHSSVFPEGIVIGYINKAVANNATSFCDIDVDLAVDFQSLDYVIVTAYEGLEEIIAIQKSREGTK